MGGSINYPENIIGFEELSEFSVRCGSFIVHLCEVYNNLYHPCVVCNSQLSIECNQM